MSSPPHVPYQAYKSKRHSRTASNLFAPNLSSPPASRPSSVISNRSLNGVHPQHTSDTETYGRSSSREGERPVEVDSRPNSVSPNGMSPPVKMNGGGSVHNTSSSSTETSPVRNKGGETSPGKDTMVVQAPAPIRGGDIRAVPPSVPPILNGKQEGNTDSEPEPESESEPVAGPSMTSPSTSNSAPAPIVHPPPVPPVPVTPTSMSRKSSSFRHVPLRGSAVRSPLPSSPLRPAGTHHSRAASASASMLSASTIRQFEQPIPPQPHRTPTTQTQTQPRSRITSLASVHSTIAMSDDSSSSSSKQLPSIPSSQESVYPERGLSSQLPSSSAEVIVPPPRIHSLPTRPSAAKHQARSPSQSNSSSPAATPKTAPSPAISPAPSLPFPYPTPASTSHPRAPAPYRPGFQPKGVYRPLTEEFTSARKIHRDVGRIERTKLERRLEKLIQLHFSSDADGNNHNNKGAQLKVRPAAATVVENRRASSFFDLDLSDLRNLDAGELWRGVIQSQTVQGGKADIRAAEQRITPWQDDASVSKCPLCTASFHPLTNRKHHCRLCGQIICSLPVKRPQRPETCSLLFVVDPKTRRIEEVGEGVDYGVRKRRSLPPPGPGKGKQKEKEKEKEEPLQEDEKFLKGVRICRQCRPILLRQQYHQEVVHVPTFSRLYEVFISLEKEIEESLPQFQELILILSHDDQPTKEASAARKRLLEAFAQYDALAKRIRKIPCPGGKGSSEDRVQLAILSRANLFLQKNMFPLQSLPKPELSKSAKSPSQDDGPVIDPDSAVAHALQPLLEQEALLESFVEEAKAHRKFEDAKTLKTNLQEIRAEIDKIMANADTSMSQPSSKKASTGRK